MKFSPQETVRTCVNHSSRDQSNETLTLSYVTYASETYDLALRIDFFLQRCSKFQGPYYVFLRGQKVSYCCASQISFHHLLYWLFLQQVSLNTVGQPANALRNQPPQADLKEACRRERYHEIANTLAGEKDKK